MKKIIPLSNRLFRQAFLLLFILPFMISCNKDFLEAKPDKALLVPETLTDFRNLLDNLAVFNLDPALGEVASDDFQLDDTGLMSLPQTLQDTYTWNKTYTQGTVVTNWSTPYKQVFYCNVVLKGLENYNGPQNGEFLELRGAALFLRARAYYELLQVYAPAYRISGNNSQLAGIPLKDSPDVNEKLTRFPLAECYERIIQDLKQSIALLVNRDGYKSRPGKTAALAMLSKVYLTMGNYKDCADYARQVLVLQADMVDYNTLVVSATKPFPVVLPSGNPEVIFYSQTITNNYLNLLTTVTVDPGLYAMYEANDLRKVLYYRDRGNGILTFKGSYSGALPNNSTSVFSGLATDEVRLNLAESLIRLDRIVEGLNELNLLLVKRYKTGTYTPISISDKDLALHRVLLERRKSLCSRNTRWTDLRRLNQEEATALTLRRPMNSGSWILPPGDARYTFPLPLDEISYGLQQNDR